MDTGTVSIVDDEELYGLLEDLDPATEPALCDGFEDLSWRSTLKDLPKTGFTEVVFRGIEFAGYYGSAHYIFDGEDRLIMGTYLFNELMSLLIKVPYVKVAFSFSHELKVKGINNSGNNVIIFAFIREKL